jgi:hypothetical protein
MRDMTWWLPMVKTKQCLTLLDQIKALTPRENKPVAIDIEKNKINKNPIK